MGIFDESYAEAGHRRLASSISAEIEALGAAIDLIRRVTLSKDLAYQHQNYLAISTLGFRVVNAVGAATKLIDCGYFVQAASLCRGVAELGMLALYFAEQPDKIADWQNTTSDSRYKRFGRSALKSKITNKRKFDYLNVRFDFFSEYGTHPSSTSIIAHHDGTTFQIGPHRNAISHRADARWLDPCDKHRDEEEREHREM